VNKEPSFCYPVVKVPTNPHVIMRLWGCQYKKDAILKVILTLEDLDESVVPRYIIGGGIQ
jgi:hypothetical protein